VEPAVSDWERGERFRNFADKLIGNELRHEAIRSDSLGMGFVGGTG